MQGKLNEIRNLLYASQKAARVDSKIFYENPNSNKRLREFNMYHNLTENKPDFLLIESGQRSAVYAQTLLALRL